MPAESEASSPTGPDRLIEGAWHTERSYLISMAARMLHTGAGAEDVVQEAFGRLARVDVAQIHDVRGWPRLHPRLAR